MTKKVKIAEFKSRLSEHLRSVRGGDEIVILDRDRPVAKVSPYDEESSRTDFRVRPAKLRGGWSRMKWPSQTVDADAVSLLRDDRNRR